MTSNFYGLFVRTAARARWPVLALGGALLVGVPPARSGPPVVAQAGAAPAPAPALAAAADAIPGRQAEPDPSAPVVRPAGAGRVALSRAAFLPPSYVEREYWLEGPVQIYEPAGDWERDGRWAVRPLPSDQRYATRLLVRRPADPARFNGVVVVEWLNTTFKFDVDGEWALSHEEFIREGYAWVGITADKDGVQGLREIDAARYAGLRIADQPWAYGIFSQAGRAVREQAPLLLGVPRPAMVLAGGYSQSAVYLTTYANALQPRDKVYDGFLLHGRAPFGSPITSSPFYEFDPAIRDDLDVPVMQVQSEGEPIVSWPLSKTRDTARVRYWEVAGTAHMDRDMVAQVAAIATRDRGIEAPECLRPVNAAPLRAVNNAAWHALRRWVSEGAAPPTAPRLARTDWGFIAEDEHGNAQGGVRLPDLDVPVARYGVYLSNFTAGSWAFVNTFGCVAGGYTRPFDAAELRRLYPSGDVYLERYRKAADAALAAGFLRPADHAALIEGARLRAAGLPGAAAAASAVR